ncbi:hypothetical protein A6A29_16510 [Streptomyces sp. TSRI0281]|nr:hypothetical protein A6A29_16510 [Streptomyces sp. TSRI0281]
MPRSQCSRSVIRLIRYSSSASSMIVNSGGVHSNISSSFAKSRTNAAPAPWNGGYETTPAPSGIVSTHVRASSQAYDSSLRTSAAARIFVMVFAWRSGHCCSYARRILSQYGFDFFPISGASRVHSSIVASCFSGVVCSSVIHGNSARAGSVRTRGMGSPARYRPIAVEYISTSQEWSFFPTDARVFSTVKLPQHTL